MEAGTKPCSPLDGLRTEPAAWPAYAARCDDACPTAGRWRRYCHHYRAELVECVPIPDGFTLKGRTLTGVLGSPSVVTNAAST